MNIITFRLHTQFNSIFPVVKIISEWLLLRAVFSLARRGCSPCREEDANGGVPGGGEGMTEVIQYRSIGRLSGGGNGGGFEGSGGRWMPRGWHDFKRFAGGVNINLGK